MTVRENLRDYYLAFVRGVQVVKRMLEVKQPIYRNETKRKDRICQERKKAKAAVRGTNDDT